jgi:hypothetical protein
MIEPCAVVLHQIVNGRHKLEMCALHPSTGPVVGFANLWRGSRMCTNGAGKETVQSGAHPSKP